MKSEKVRVPLLFAFSLLLFTSVAESSGDAAAGEALEQESSPIVSAEVSLTICSKALYYGFVHVNEPTFDVDGYLTFFDCLSVGGEAIFSLTRYGHDIGLQDRRFKYVEFDPNVTLEHAFAPDDVSWLPTTVAFELNYDYEYIGWMRSGRNAYKENDTQYWTLTVSLPDLWLEPRFLYERDVVRDNGTYLNLALGHTFALVDGEGKEPLLALRPSVAQGFGNGQRVGGYLFHDDGEYTPLDHAGLMDTYVKLTLTWKGCEWLKLSAYAGYSDFLFDRKIREAARRYEPTGDWTHSWNFVGGCTLTAEF